MRYNRYIKHILNRKLGGYVYEKGDLIIYGNQSVCRIENIGVISIGKQPNSRNASFDFDRGVRTIIDQTS